MNAQATVQAKFAVRNVEFDLNTTVPKYWHSNRRAVTIFFNNLSTLFPAGEEFFIKSIVAYKKYIKDPQLLAEIKAFSGQEGIHTREHIRYNEMLVKQGYRANWLEKRTEIGLKLLIKVLPKRASLAVTAALEHWTSMLAHFVLADASILAGAHPVMAGIWRWHAAEECEHKAVSFDVYERIGGDYLTRVVIQLAATLGLWGVVLVQQFELMKDDGMQWSLKEWRDLGRFLFVEQKAIKRLAPIWLEYFELNYHPWHNEDSHLIEKWKLDYETNPVYKKRVKRQATVRPAMTPQPAPA